MFREDGRHGLENGVVYKVAVGGLFLPVCDELLMQGERLLVHREFVLEGNCEPDVSAQLVFYRIGGDHYVPVSSDEFKLDGHVAMTVLAQIGSLVRNLPELIQSLWRSGTGCILVGDSDTNLACLRRIAPERNHRPILIVLDVIRPVLVSFDMRLCCFGRVRDKSTPEKGRVECLDVESGDEAKVCRTALQRLPKVSVFVLVGIYDASVSVSVEEMGNGCEGLPIAKDDFKVDNLVASETTSGCVKSIATSGQESSDANC